MNKPSGTRHKNYEILNLIGYGLAKFEGDLIAALGFKTKSALFNHLIVRGVAETRGTLKNRQDLFNPLVRKAKVGWWQSGDRYLHRKILLDSLFGELDAVRYSAVVENYLQTYFPIPGEKLKPIVPILKSKFRQLQETGSEAELFFMNTFRTVERLKDGVLEDARLFGDGYDFQITLAPAYVLAEVKGVRGSTGGIRLTENEYLKAKEFKDDYCIAVVSQLEDVPRISVFFNPLEVLPLSRQTITSEQVYYSSPVRRW
ncbi:MAG: DUF3883 domain-containing protein [Acidobacteria bacterium]|nr:DUF3883 domain-containing protein [Acidobacteriota bacterium]